MSRFIDELKRRKVVGAGMSYVVGAWLLLQAAAIVFPAISMPQWSMRVLIVALLVGFPLWLAVAWIYDLTADGFKRTTELSKAEAITPRNLRAPNAVILTLLIVAVVLLGVNLKRGGIFGRGFDRVPGAQLQSIAVLPFENISGDPDQEYFSHGITEDIVTQLSKIAGLRVVSRTTTMQYRERADRTPGDIGEQLNVDAILEGSVRIMGDKVRIVSQLIDTHTDVNLWAEAYDRDLQDIFAIQADVARQIARAMEANLSPEEERSIGQTSTASTEAYQLFLQGRYFWNQRIEESINRAIDYFQQAVAVDPNYALAYAGLGDAYLMLGIHSAMAPEESIPLAEGYLEKALELDSDLSDAYATLIDINIHYYWDADAAERHFQKAIEADAENVNAYHWHSEVYVMRGEFDRAFQESQTALSLEPYSPIINVQLGTNLIHAGQSRQAIHQLRRTLEYDSAFALTHHSLGIAYVGVGELENALHHLRTARDLAPDNIGILATLGYLEGVTGNTREAQRIETELLSESERTYVPSYDLAKVALGLRKHTLALQRLEQAYRERDPWMPFIGMNPLFDMLKDNPEFAELVRNVYAIQ